MLKRIAVVALLLFAGNAVAFEACFAEAAQKFNVDRGLLMAIAKVESGFNPSAVRKPFAAGNSDGSTDYGLMQINTVELNALRSHGVTQDDLFDACTNIKIGAFVLSKKISRFGNTWKAVGAYNANSPDKQQIYINKVREAYNKLASVNFDLQVAMKNKPIALTYTGLRTKMPSAEFVVFAEVENESN